MMHALRASWIAAVLLSTSIGSTTEFAVAQEPVGAANHDPDPDDYVKEVRLYGSYANDYADRALRLCERAYSTFGGGDSAAYAYGFTFYASDFGEQAGIAVWWDASDGYYGPAREEAFRSYYYLRYQQGLYDFYASYYARQAFLESGLFAWYDVATLAQGATYYAKIDLPN